MVSDATDARFWLRYLAALGDDGTVGVEGREADPTPDGQRSEALDTAVVVADIEGCSTVRPRDLALVEEMGEEFDVEVIEGDDAMRWPDAVRAPADFDTAAQLGRRSPVEGQAEHTAKVSRLISLVAVSLRRDRRLAAAGCRDDVDESVRRGRGKHLGIG